MSRNVTVQVAAMVAPSLLRAVAIASAALDALHAERRDTANELGRIADQLAEAQLHRGDPVACEGAIQLLRALQGRLESPLRLVDSVEGEGHTATARTGDLLPFRKLGEGETDGSAAALQHEDGA